MWSDRQFPRRWLERWSRIPGLILVLLVVIGVLYSPILTAYFNADDYSFLRYLYFNSRQLMDGQLWYEWLVGGIVNYSVFRPMAHALWLLNYVAFGLEPFGYHLVAVVSHAAAAFLAFVLGHQLTGNRMTAALGALFFAVMPVHAEAVAWLAANYDVWCAIYSFTSLISYILYRQRGAFHFYLLSLGAFILALSSREIALTLPLMLFVYDIIYHRQDWVLIVRSSLGYLPFGAAIILRLAFFGHGYHGLDLAPEGWWYYVDWNLWRVFDPFSEWLSEMRWIALGGAIVLLLAFRFRPAVLFSLIWIPVLLVATTVGGVNDRSFYISSFGLSLIFAIVFASFINHKAMLIRVVGLVGLLALITAYSLTLVSRNQFYARASRVTQTIVQRIKELHPTLPTDARLVFVGVPDYVPEGAPVFGSGFREAVSIAYRNEPLSVLRASQFPIWQDNLDHTYFFLVDHSRVAERADIVQALKAREQCGNLSQPAVVWDFTHNEQGWEPWNQLDEMALSDGVWTMRATGDDSYLGSPPLDIPTNAIGDIEITLRVRADQPTFQGSIYWSTSNQQDFSPALRESFTEQSDGEFHTLHVDISKQGTLTWGDRVVRLRLDPVDHPAEIALRSIRVYLRCNVSGNSSCSCAP